MAVVYWGRKHLFLVPINTPNRSAFIAFPQGATTCWSMASHDYLRGLANEWHNWRMRQQVGTLGDSRKGTT